MFYFKYEILDSLPEEIDLNQLFRCASGENSIFINGKRHASTSISPATLTIFSLPIFYEDLLSA